MFSGLDDSKFDSSTLVTLDATDDNFWITHLGGVTVNGATVAISGNRTALMDTGTTLLVVPSTDVDPIHEKIPGAIKTGTGSWTVPCNTTASVALQFGGKSFPISPKDLPFASGGRTTGDCTSGIGGFSAAATASNPTQWLVRTYGFPSWCLAHAFTGRRHLPQVSILSHPPMSAHLSFFLGRCTFRPMRIRTRLPWPRRYDLKL